MRAEECGLKAMADRLISRQLRRSEVGERLRESAGLEREGARASSEVVTISRQHGSGGTVIGRRIAERLGWDFYDRELIDSVAEHIGAEPETVETHDERPPNLVHDLVRQLLEGKRPTETQYLRSLVRILRLIRGRGQAVIMGRGAHLVLPDALRVRIVAPLEVRIERVAEAKDLPLAEARRVVLASDRDREQFIRAHFGVDGADPCYYDLVLNTAALSGEQVVQVVLCAVEARSRGAER